MIDSLGKVVMGPDGRPWDGNDPQVLVTENGEEFYGEGLLEVTAPLITHEMALEIQGPMTPERIETLRRFQESIGTIPLRRVNTITVDNVSLGFKTVLQLHSVDGQNSAGPIVRYDVRDRPLLITPRSGYLVTVNSVIVYCRTFTKTFGRRWLYRKLEYVYQFKREFIAQAVPHNVVLVHAESEGSLRSHIGQPGNNWSNVTSIEDRIVRHLNPIWNVNGLQKQHAGVDT